MPDNIFGELQRAWQEKERHKENSAREVNFHSTYETTGSGELIPTSVVPFQVPFFQEPHVTHGCAIQRLPDRNFYRLPTVTGGVLRWERNARGFYVGAFVFFRIHCDLQPSVQEEVDDIFEPSQQRAFIQSIPMAMPRIIHHFHFVGPGYKQMGRRVYEGVQDEGVRPLLPPGTRR